MSFIEKTSGTAIAVSLLFAAPAYAQGVLTGTVMDTTTKRPIDSVVVVATSPALQGSQNVVTDKSGSYRIPNLPVGVYTLSFAGDGFKPYTRGSITIRVDSTVRVDAALVRESIKPE